MVVDEQSRRSPAGEEMVCAIWTCIIGRLLRLLTELLIAWNFLRIRPLPLETRFKNSIRPINSSSRTLNVRTNALVISVLKRRGYRWATDAPFRDARSLSRRVIDYIMDS